MRFWRKIPNMKEVLGYNEPDEPNSVGGSNMTVDEALQGFQYISALKSNGIAVGGPACAVDTDDWMSSFMSQATAAPYSYNIRFYRLSMITRAKATSTMRLMAIWDFLDAVYKQYNLPIWATEFAPTNSGSDGRAHVYSDRLPGLAEPELCSTVLDVHQRSTGCTSGMGDSALVNSDGSLTAAGNLYARM